MICYLIKILRSEKINVVQGVGTTIVNDCILIPRNSYPKVATIGFNIYAIFFKYRGLISSISFHASQIIEYYPKVASQRPFC